VATSSLTRFSTTLTDMTLATPEPIKEWSLTSLKEKLIKIGAKVVSHGRYVAFQMAEVAIPRRMFQEILRLIANCGRSLRLHGQEVFDGHGFKGNRREECVQMPTKWPDQPPRPPFGVPELRPSRPYRQAVLSKRGNSAKIHPGFGFIWRISD
jgi:hypothetical protein